MAPAEKYSDSELSNSVDLNLKYGILAYLDYSVGAVPLAEGGRDYYNRFSLTRGYLTFRLPLSSRIKIRSTIDACREDHDDSRLDGSYVARFKYFYGRVDWQDAGFLTHLHSEVGLGHTPWLSFEEHINPYRSQGTMFLERSHIMNSADMGISLAGLLGDELENAQERVGSDNHAGKWGSFQVGAYNGGGYHAVEENQNKVVQARLSLRPFPAEVPGLQISWFGAYGEGNRQKGDILWGTTLEGPPDYNANLVMVSFQHPRFIAAAQYLSTTGNAFGNYVDDKGESLKTSGLSAFLNVRLTTAPHQVAVFGRYDFFDTDVDDKSGEDSAYSLSIAGLSYKPGPHHLLLLAWEGTYYREDAGGKGEVPRPGNGLPYTNKYQLVWQIKY